MNFLVKSRLYKVFFTYYENLLTKNMKKIIFLLINFIEKEKLYLLKKRKALSFKKKEKPQNLTF
jgi:penicillin-binding protein-related factor A (putative recombinase)